MKKIKEMSIDEVVIEAHKMDISYGKYVAMEEGLMKVEIISQNNRAADNRPERGKSGRRTKV